MMKKLTATILTIVLLMTGVAIAEDSESDAQAIFNSLAYIYDGSIYFLKQQQTTWDNVLTAKASDNSYSWFLANMLNGNEEHDMAIYFFTTINGYEEPYKDLFLPLFDYYGHTDEGFKKACFAFTVMVFGDTRMKDQLEEEKQNIKDLMNSDPDYPYLKEIQELYKKTSQVLDYAWESSDSYILTASRISDYEQVRREQKSEFDFIFDWPEYTFKTVPMPEGFGAIIKAYHEAQAEAQEEAAKAAEQAAIAELHRFDYAGGVGNGLIDVRRDDKWGFIDLEGNIVIDLKYDDTMHFSEGYAWVQIGEDYSLIDTEGKVVIPDKFWHVQWFKNGAANVQVRGESWKKIDATGKTLEKYNGFPPAVTNELSAKYGSAHPEWQFDSVIDGYAPVWNRNTQKWGCINSDGELVIPCEYKRVACGENVFVLIDESDYLTIVDVDGNVLF